MTLTRAKLFEIAITTVIGGLIIITSIAWFLDSEQHSRDIKRIADIGQLQKALTGYYSEHRAYPGTKELYDVLPDLPRDPSGVRYGYERPDTDSYVVGACLESTRDASVRSYSRADAETYAFEVGGARSCTCASLNAYCVNQDM